MVAAGESTAVDALNSPRQAGRFADAIKWALVASGLGAILFYAFGLVVPRRPDHWSWGAPGLAFLAGSLALLLFRVSRPEERLGKAIDSAALVLGLASMVLGVGASIVIGVGLSLHFSEATGSSQARIYLLTDLRVLGSILAYAGGATLPGVLGFAISRWRRRCTGRVSAAGAAYRFSVGGLAMAALIASAAGAAALYRWINWGVF